MVDGYGRFFSRFCTFSIFLFPDYYTFIIISSSGSKTVNRDTLPVSVLCSPGGALRNLFINSCGIGS